MAGERSAPFDRDFYSRPVLTVARRLIGQTVVRVVDGRRTAGRIVETEAYGGTVDPASHSFRGLTSRCRTMFGPAGHAYVYFIYGNHCCFNVVAGSRERAEAVLIRAVEPLEGIPTLRSERVARARPGRTRNRLQAGEADRDLANGPGKLAAAFAIELDLDGHDLTRGEILWIEPAAPIASVVWTPRIGLGRSPAAGWFWRCVASGTKHATPTRNDLPTRTRPARD